MCYKNTDLEVFDAFVENDYINLKVLSRHILHKGTCKEAETWSGNPLPMLEMK